MPLIPGLTNTGGDDKTTSWVNKLTGKKIGDSSNETVRFLRCIVTIGVANACQQTFAKTELPKEHRIIKEGDMSTMDHKPDRLNIHTADDGTVTKVTHG
ncbi:hypothetical protein LTR10_004162 [Elasticomyces elasticus]|nr:hypothetical protein LTR10_004162 [Elasticomyces elasticus]KAK4977655.1 hypothetical protein LTR42_002026 [Elasticomyces elasticus]